MRTVVECAFGLTSLFGTSRAHTRYTSADGTPTATRTIDLEAATKAAAIDVWTAQTEVRAARSPAHAVTLRFDRKYKGKLVALICAHMTL